MATPSKRVCDNKNLIVFRVKPHHLKMLQSLADKAGLSKSMMARQIVIQALNKELEQ